MSNLRQIMAGVLAGLISLVIIIGSVWLAFAEGRTGTASLPATVTETPSPVPTLQPGDPTFTPSPTTENTATTVPTPVCPFPLGWETLVLTEEDNLEAIALERGISLDELMTKNCMESPVFVPDTILYVPPLPTSAVTSTPEETLPPTSTSISTQAPTFTPHPTVVCGPLAGWILYTVKPGDTLFSLSQAYYTTVALLQKANCLTGTTIVAGKQIYVPNVSTRTLTPSVTLAATETLTPTPLTPTLPPTITFTPSPTETGTATLTVTPTPSDTPTETASPTSTPSPTSIPPSDTPLPTDTSTP